MDLKILTRSRTCDFRKPTLMLLSAIARDSKESLWVAKKLRYFEVELGWLALGLRYVRLSVGRGKVFLADLRLILSCP